MTTPHRTTPPPPAAVRGFEFPDVARTRLRSGMSVLHARHGRLPLVTVELVIDAGAAAERPDRGGLAHLVGNALHAGTATRSAERLAWDLETLGVQLEISTSWDALVVKITTPSAKLEPAFAILADIVRNAAFPEGDVQRLREEQLAEILQRLKEPRALASDVALRCLFAPAVPYARPLIGTREMVSAITRDDVVRFHRERFVPAHAALLFVGDLDEATATQLAEQHFGDWGGEAGAITDFEVQPASTESAIYLVDRPGAVQSELRVGLVGVPRDHDDYFPLLVMNTLFGGAFTSRLNLNLREKHGFTYGVRSGFAFRRRPGPFFIQTAVGTEVTAQAVTEILSETRRLREDGITEEELDNARDYLIGVMPLELQTTAQLAATLAEIVIFQLPVDYFRDYRDRIRAVQAADVQRVARAHLRTDEFAVVVVGNAEAVRSDLEALQRGRVVDMAPEPALA